MALPFHLGLRKNNHMISVIRTAEGARPQLGVAYPDDSHRRSHIPTNWGINGQAPRQSEAATVNLPLSQRAQTILSYRLSPELQQQLNGGLSPMTHSRYDLLPGIKQRVHIGHDHADLFVRSHMASTSSPSIDKHAITMPSLSVTDNRRIK